MHKTITTTKQIVANRSRIKIPMGRNYRTVKLHQTGKESAGRILNALGTKALNQLISLLPRDENTAMSFVVAFEPTHAIRIDRGATTTK